MSDSPRNHKREEYAVYSRLIDSRYVNESTRLIVIEEQTELALWGENLRERLASLSELLPEGAEALIEEFVRKNKQSSRLKADFALSVPYVLISSLEMDDIFQIDHDGWVEFYRRYPDAPGTITLSRVGFDTRLDQALVYTGIQSHWRAGEGHLVLLGREAGRWEIHSQSMIWIS